MNGGAGHAGHAGQVERAERAERVIIGAGLAGSAAAIALARAGAAPLLLERAAAQARPRICGEFVSAEAAAALATLGVDLQALGGRPTRRLRVACGAVCIDAELPFEAFGLTRLTLDAALQAQAERHGAALRRGQRVVAVALPPPADGLRQPFVLQLAGGADVETPTLLLACGKSDLAPLARRPRHPPEALVGLQAHLVLAPDQAAAIDGHVEVLLFDGAKALMAVGAGPRDGGAGGGGHPGRHRGDAGGLRSHDGYAGLQPVDGGRVNLCLLVDRALARHGLPAALAALRRQCPLLDERLAGARWPATPPQSIARVPYGYLVAAPGRPSGSGRWAGGAAAVRPAAGGSADPPNLWRLGDQAAVIPSFTGDGMAIALHSAALAAEVLLAGGDASAYHQRLRDDVGAQLARAMALYRAGRSAAGRRALLVLLRRWPSLLGFIATMTRVPAAVLRWG